MFFAFRCAKTGLFYPDDYIDNWGKKYGVGYGSEPISEALYNDYNSRVCGQGQSAMHPLAACRSQVDCVHVDLREFEQNQAILQVDDEKMIARALLMRDKQLIKSITMQQMHPADVDYARSRLEKPAQEYLARVLIDYRTVESTQKPIISTETEL